MKTLNKIILTLISLGIFLGALNLYKATRTVHYKLNTPIDFTTAEKFKQFIIDLGKGNTAVIHIESWGGYIISMHKIIYYLDKSDAATICYVDSHAASAAAMILMHCTYKHVTPRAEITFHLTQMCTEVSPYGKCIKYRPVSPLFYPELYKESVEELNIAKTILTDDEWNAMLLGEDITLKGSTFMERLRAIEGK